MTLARRTVVSFAWLLALAVVAGGYAIYELDRIVDGHVEERRIQQAAEHANFLDSALLQAILLLEQYVDTGDDAKLEELRKLRTETTARRAALRSITRIPRVTELLDAYETIQVSRNLLLESIVEVAGSGGAGLVELRRDRDLLDRRARAHLREIVRVESETLAAAAAANRAGASQLRITGVALLAAILGVAMFIAFSLARDIGKRVAPLLEMSGAMSRGDFDARVPVQGSDEVATLAAAMNDMAARLRELDHAKDEFVALASHQLRTPATAVKANLAMLLDGYFGQVPVEQREYVQDAYDSNERQLEVIEDILNVARAETGRLYLDKAPVDLARLVDEIAGEHRHGIVARGQEFEIELPPQPVILPLDVRKARMVVDNLISNASKYTPDGGHVRVRLEDDGARATIEVEDSGVGIAPADQDRVFQKFSRVDNRLSVSAGGTGLGLYLAAEIVRLHGGEITVDSELDKGSTFRIVLPRS